MAKLLLGLGPVDVQNLFNALRPAKAVAKHGVTNRTRANENRLLLTEAGRLLEHKTKAQIISIYRYVAAFSVFLKVKAREDLGLAVTQCRRGNSGKVPLLLLQ